MGILPKTEKNHSWKSLYISWKYINIFSLCHKQYSIICCTYIQWQYMICCMYAVALYVVYIQLHYIRCIHTVHCIICCTYWVAHTHTHTHMHIHTHTHIHIPCYNITCWYIQQYSILHMYSDIILYFAYIQRHYIIRCILQCPILYVVYIEWPYIIYCR